jgi:lipopolysaccharide heptosyltransferase II
MITYQAPWIKATPPRQDSRPEREIVERLRQARFDAAVIFTVYSQSALPAGLLCYLADIPLRLAHCRENPYQILTDWVRDPEPETVLRHEVRRQLDLVATIGARTHDERLSLVVPARGWEAARRCVIERIDEQRPWVVIHPGASAESRRYPAEQFAAAARYLAEDFGCQIIFTGTESERVLVDAIRSGMEAPSHSLVGELDLAGLSGLIAMAPLLISNNTGPVHIAAAVGTPVVDLYALTNPQHTPWHVPHRVLFHDVPCKYCYKSVCPEGHHDCLRLVRPEAVAEAAAELLRMPSDRRSAISGQAQSS